MAILIITCAYYYYVGVVDVTFFKSIYLFLPYYHHTICFIVPLPYYAGRHPLPLFSPPCLALPLSQFYRSRLLRSRRIRKAGHLTSGLSYVSWECHRTNQHQSTLTTKLSLTLPMLVDLHLECNMSIPNASPFNSDMKKGILSSSKSPERSTLPIRSPKQIRGICSAHR